MSLKAENKIGDWSEERLAKFIRGLMINAVANDLPRSISPQQVTVQSRLVVRDRIELSPQALQYIKDNLPP